MESKTFSSSILVSTFTMIKPGSRAVLNFHSISYSRASSASNAVIGSSPITDTHGLPTIQAIHRISSRRCVMISSELLRRSSGSSLGFGGFGLRRLGFGNDDIGLRSIFVVLCGFGRVFVCVIEMCVIPVRTMCCVCDV